MIRKYRPTPPRLHSDYGLRPRRRRPTLVHVEARRRILGAQPQAIAYCKRYPARLEQMLTALGSGQEKEDTGHLMKYGRGTEVRKER